MVRSGAYRARPGHRGRDVLAHPELGGPQHRRPVRRRRGRGHCRAGVRGRVPRRHPGRGRQRRAAAQRRRRRLAPAPDAGLPGRPRQHRLPERPGSVQVRRADHGRGRRAGREVARPDDRTTWTCSSRTRPTSASSRKPPSGWACRWRKSSSTWTATATRRAASIPLALDEAVKAGRVRRGDLVVLVGFGAGLTWGANVIRWSK